MAKKTAQNTRRRIVSAAWSLFYEQGYEHTTVEEIIELSNTSKGSFYHYFSGKDALLSTLSDLFDEKYETLLETMPPHLTAMEQLLYLNGELFGMIETSVPLELLARMLSTQIVTSGKKHLLDHRRVYYRLLRRIINEGQQSGELTSARPCADLVKIYALCERALMYDWCLCGGEYSLRRYAADLLPAFLRGLLQA